jgi:DNA-binding NarL/FixJ family response regulator
MNTPADGIPRILVIEDEPQMLRNLTTILRIEGFHPIPADNGARGLELARIHPPDLILCDRMMPGMDGFAVLAELRSKAETAAIPFVFLTARGERDDVRAGMVHGADDYLTKPVKVDELVSAVRTRLARRREAVAVEGGTTRRPTSAAELLRLGVSEREADVLFWLIEGKGNADIGAILGIAPSTVKKHLEHIFEKLGVENRTAAIMAALHGGPG